MKKSVRYSLLVLVVFFIQVLGVDALSVSSDKLEISSGNNKSVDLYVDVENEITKLEFNFIYSTFDIPANLVLVPGYNANVSGVKYSANFGEAVSGKIKLGQIDVSVDSNPTDLVGTVNMNNAVATTIDGLQVNLDSQVITVNVVNDDTPDLDDTDDNVTSSVVEDEKVNDNSENKETKKEERKHLIKEIKSDIVDIKLKDKVFKYTVFIDDEVEELDLKPVLFSDDYKVEITSQKIKELKDNNILITVSKGEEKEVYTKNVQYLKIDTEKNVSKNDYKGSWIGAMAGSIVVLVFGVILARKK